MAEKKNTVHLGENVADDVKLAVNEEMKAIMKMVITTFSQSLKAKIPELPEKIEKKIKEIVDKPETVDEIAEVWSRELYKKGLVPKGYNGLPDELLIANFHQDGYLDGLYAGYVLAMMALVDNEAEKELILSVRDDIRPNLVGHHYDNRDEFYKRFKGETYSWIESPSRIGDK
ncbi:hypothetical protein [Diplocloster modestus]|uniref:DUF1642 domain-containing protein n=1 Tax=Diplocloster modestus TaxID=2850322 RepID=A0ABS6K4S4_9FIRM|nr:hypothetical protein [Diplocloster modestus]MBU9725515.1 hypothetical protein [Diplocloster modestus]